GRDEDAQRPGHRPGALRLDDDRDDHRPPPEPAGRPPAHHPAHDLLQLVRVGGAAAGGVGQLLGDLGQDGVEDRLVLGHAARLDVGAGDDRAGGGVDGGEDGDEALLAEDAPVLELGLGDLSDTRAVDVDVAARHRTDDARLAVDEVDDDAVLGEHDPLGRYPGLHRVCAVGDEVTDLAVDRHDVAGLDDVVDVQQLACARVDGDVHQDVSLLEHLRADASEPVDDPVDGVLVPGDEGGGEDHRVAGADGDAVVAVGDPAQRRNRLALGAGGNEDELVVAQVVDLLDVDDGVLGDGEVAQFGGDAHVAHHGASDEGHLAAVGVGGVEHLLDAVDVRGEGRDDDL